MRYIGITVIHQPDAGQASSRRFKYPNRLDYTDEGTAREFAFKALEEENFQKGIVEVVFPETANYAFRFERLGLVGFNLTPTQTLPTETLRSYNR